MAAPLAVPARAHGAWRLRLLGAIELTDAEGRPQRLPSRAATLLLARLALAPRRQHPREELAELLWPGSAAEVGRNRLRQSLSVLRAVLEPTPAAAESVLQGDRRALWLVPGALSCDAQALRDALDRGDTATASLLAQGDLLPGHFDEWVLEERAHWAARLEALSAVAARQPSAPPALPTPDAGLPRYLTRLIGFDTPGTQLAARVCEHRLVVLRGPGGAGKTRLAIEVARQLATSHRGDGTHPGFDLVAFVPLAACTTREQMIEGVLHALRQGGAGAPTAAPVGDTRVQGALAGRSVLLVLDNFEQLVESARADIARWLAELPLLHLLVTSRRALGLDGEVEHVLSPLPLPAPLPLLGPAEVDDVAALARNPAVALFIDRARAVQPAFELTPALAGALSEVVAALHGLPLAIELAAARLRSLGLPDLHRMLVQDSEPGAALALLARNGPRGGDDPRHASMQRVLEWSWQQLDAADQALLPLLAACDGGASLELLALLCGQTAGAAAARVDGLVAASVAYRRAEAGGASRVHAFEPMREFVFMQAGAAGVMRLREQQAAAMAAWAAAQGREPRLYEAAAEWPNLLRALATAGEPAAPNPASAARAIDTVLDLRRMLDDMMLPPSALEHLRRAAAVVRTHRAGALQALLAHQSLAAGQADQAGAHARQAVQLASETGAERGQVLCLAARVLMRLGEPVPQVQALLDEAQAHAREQGQPDIEARCLVTLGVLRQRARDPVGAARLQEQALRLWQAHGPRTRITEGLVVRAIGLGQLKRVHEQLPLLEQAQTLAQAQGQLRLLAFVHSVTGYALADLRRLDESAAAYRRCLELAWRLNSWREWFYGLWNLPRTLAHQRQPDAAARLMGFAEAFYAQRFGPLGSEDLPEARRTRRLVVAQLGRARAEAAWADGAGLSMRDAMALALQQSQPG